MALQQTIGGVDPTTGLLKPWIPNTPGSTGLPTYGTPGTPNPPPWIPTNPDPASGVPQATAPTTTQSPTSDPSSAFQPTTDTGPSPFGPWTGTFTPPTPTPLPSAPTGPGNFAPPPTFAPPTYTPPPAFAPPSVGDALNDPGYIFRRNQGADTLQRWAAAKGTLNDSGTAKALTDYGQNAASQEYQNVFQRQLQGYQENYQTQYQDPYTAAYQAAKDQFAPQLSTYNTNLTASNNARQTGYLTDAANVQHQNDTANANAWNWLLLGLAGL